MVRKRRVTGWTLGSILGTVLLGLLSLAIIASGTGREGFLWGAALATLPVPVYLGVALWLDRFEPEPGWMLARAFFWGASSAVFLALLVNSAVADAAARALGDGAAEPVAALLSAPFVEELAKALVLVQFFRRHPDEFDDVTDGVIYAAMVGLGFAMLENIQYYGRGLREAGTVPYDVLVVRGVLSPYAHPLFTAMTGIGLGIAREDARGPRRRLAPVVGFVAAVGLHFLWNLSAELGAFRAVYAAVMVPTFALTLGVVARSIARERRVIREHLRRYVATGLLSDADVHRLSSLRGRLRASLRAFLTGGPAGYLRHVRYRRAACELAFHEWRVSRGISAGPVEDAVRAEQLAAALEASRP